jgi:hypothetical protein
MVLELLKWEPIIMPAWPTFFPGNGKIGVIEKGAQADLILVDYLPFTEMTPGNLPWHIQFGLEILW